jgi:hypothetical protein
LVSKFTVVSNWFQTPAWGLFQSFDLEKEYQTCLDPITPVSGATHAAAPDKWFQMGFFLFISQAI